MAREDHATHNVEPAPAPQRERPVSGPRKWTITAMIAAVFLGVMYGVTAYRLEVQDEHRQIEIRKDAATPAPGLTRPAN